MAGSIRSSVSLLPRIGLGTCHMKESSFKSVLDAAIDAGYRLIDSAYMYPTEKLLGKALKDLIDAGKIKREEMFITSKLPWNGMRPDSVEHFCRKSMESLKSDYLDLYLIHSPVSTKRTANDDEVVSFEGDKVALDNVNLTDTWQAMEELVNKGLVRSIGLSNFNSQQIQRIYGSATIKPSNLQVECHAYLPQNELLDLCQKLDISMTAYAPIGSPYFPEFARNVLQMEGYEAPTLLKDEKLKPLAEKHKKTPAQILLRFLVQRGISVIPKTDSTKRLKENINIFDFELDADDLRVLKSLNRGLRYFTEDYFKGTREHPEYPFNIPF